MATHNEYRLSLSELTAPEQLLFENQQLVFGTGANMYLMIVDHYGFNNVEKITPEPNVRRYTDGSGKAFGVVETVNEKRQWTLQTSPAHAQLIGKIIQTLLNRVIITRNPINLTTPEGQIYQTCITDFTPYGNTFLGSDGTTKVLRATTGLTLTLEQV